MREIKFRAWSKYKNLIGEVTGFRFSKSQYPFVNVRFKENGKIVDEGYHFGQEDGCDNVILMQFTGCHDKNGVEIYEGDILRDTDSEIYYVDFIRGCFYLKTKYISFPHLGWTEWLPMCEIDRLANPVDFEVIGNIYENPGLLKENG